MGMPLLIAILFWIALAGTCGYALVRGGRPERIGATINVVACLATMAARLLFASAWLPAALSVLLIDLGVVAGFFWLSIRTIRFWPIWACGFAFANILMSLMGAALPTVALFAYHTGLSIYAYLALGALWLGTFRLPPDADPAAKNGFRRQWTEKQRMS